MFLDGEHIEVIGFASIDELVDFVLDGSVRVAGGDDAVIECSHVVCSCDELSIGFILMMGSRGVLSLLTDLSMGAGVEEQLSLSLLPNLSRWLPRRKKNNHRDPFYPWRRSSQYFVDFNVVSSSCFLG